MSSMLQRPPQQQNNVFEWVRAIAAMLAKWGLSSGKLNLPYGSVTGQLTRSGQATVANATTSVAVTHGCGFTPTLQQIHITLGTATTNAIGTPYITAIGATTFQINCADPGASGATFGWMVIPI